MQQTIYNNKINKSTRYVFRTSQTSTMEIFYENSSFRKNAPS